jgi:[protein-PII] uridylyltransferase
VEDHPLGGIVIETMLYMLWDLKLKVGHSSRTVKDCLRLGAKTSPSAPPCWNTASSRPCPLATELADRLWGELFRNTGPEFIEAKLAERAERHKRQGGQRYVLEPNVKEGKGGLRDLQTLYWIGKYLHRVPTRRRLVGAGLLSREEFESFARAEDFLWAVRCHLHYITGRPTDTLTFDLQVEVAARMGYADRAGAARSKSSCRTTSATPPASAN